MSFSLMLTSIVDIFKANNLYFSNSDSGSAGGSMIIASGALR